MGAFAALPPQAIGADQEVVLEPSPGVRLRMLTFSQNEHRWLFEAVATYRREGSRKPVVTVKSKCKLDYQDGTMAAEVEVTVEIKNHEKRGREFLLGVDVSPDSHLFLTLNYQQRESELVLTEIIRGACDVIWSAEDMKEANALIQPAEAPLFIPDRLVLRYGHYEYPVKVLDGTDGVFSWPELIS